MPTLEATDFKSPQIALIVGDAPSAASTPSTAEADRNATAPAPDSVLVSNYYTDADQIPQYAVNNIANATEAGIIVSHLWAVGQR